MPRSFLVKKSEKVRGEDACRPRSPGYGLGVLKDLTRQRALTPTPPCEPDALPTASEPLASAVAPYTPTVQPLAVRISNGYIHDVLSPPPFYGGLNTDIHSGSDGESPCKTPLSVSSLSSISPPSTPPPSLLSSPSSIADDNQNYAETLESLQKSPTGFQSGVTIGYTYDAFFITDGRSRRKNALGIGLSVPDKNKPKYSCNECGKQYATSSNLSRHKQTHRSLDSKMAKRCPHCTKVYVSMPALSMHILTHSLKHVCTVCDKAFSRPWLLQGHLRSHSGEKPFGCAHCGKAFADRSNLRAHMQTHSAFKHYRCKRCNKSFALKSYLNKHYESACFKE